jgi:dTDP-6-deoxy-L-talose 4-dehydrogenase (NAD+)
LKLAVTGSTGFIGRHVVTELERRGVAATLACGTAPAAAMIPSSSAVAIRLEDDAGDAFERMGRPDVLIHLAWAGLPNYRSLHHFESELPAQYRFLSSLVRAGLRHLLVTGTCFEYGMQCGMLSESAQTFPNTAYGFAKDTLRRELEFLQRSLRYELTWMRLFYVFGPGQSSTSLYSQLGQAVARGDKEFAMSGGEQLRDYLPVEQAARDIVSLALLNRGNDVVNICSGRPISIRKLVEQWLGQNNWSIKPNFGSHPYADYEPMAFWGDRTKLAGCVG